MVSATRRADADLLTSRAHPMIFPRHLVAVC